MSVVPMKNRSATLLAILAANSHFGQAEIHRTMLVKQTFLAETIRPLYQLWKQTFKFIRYNYGPYSDDIFYCLDTLIFNGLAEVTTLERHGGRVEARYQITREGFSILDQINIGETRELAYDLVWALRSLGIDQSIAICKLVYKEAEFARILSEHTKKGISPVAKVPIQAITAANNNTFMMLTTLQELMQNPPHGEIVEKSYLPTKEVVRVFLKSLVMQVQNA